MLKYFGLGDSVKESSAEKQAKYEETHKHNFEAIVDL
jgi:hypothetical protein